MELGTAACRCCLQLREGLIWHIYSIMLWMLREN